jgi:hypothetical protein
MRAQEAVRPFANGAPGTSATFELKGGIYALDFLGTGTGTVVLNRLAGDGVTFLPVPLPAAITVSVIAEPLYLPPGQYNVVIATTTANYVTICRVPED